MEPEDLQEALIADIEEAMDMDAFKAEVEQEKKDAVAIQTMKTAALDFFKTGMAVPNQKTN